MRTLLSVFQMQMKRRLRNRRSLAWTILFPIAVVGVFALVFLPGRSLSFTLILVNNDVEGSDVYELILGGVGVAENVHVLEVEDMDEAMALLDRGAAHAILVVPEGAEENFTSFLDDQNSTPTVVFEVHYRGEDMANGDMINAILGGLADEANIRIMETFRDQEYSGPIRMESHSIDQEGWSYIDLSVPLSVGAVAIQSAVFSTSDTVTFLSENGIRKRLRCTPIGKPFLMGGIVLADGTIAALSALLAATLGSALFSIHVTPINIFGIILLSFLVGYVFSMMGFVIGNLSKNRTSSQSLSSLAVMPLIFFSFVYMIPWFFPEALTGLADALPLSRATQALGLLFLHEPTLGDMLLPSAIIAAWGAIFCTLAYVQRPRM